MSQTKRNAKSRFSSTWLVLVVGLFVVAAAVAWFEGWVDLSSDPKVAPIGATGEETNVAHRRAAPSYELRDSAGKVHTLADLKGHAVVVHFWASWCPPCLPEIPEWLAFAGRWKDKNVRFVAISLDKQWADALKILPQEKLPEGTLSLLDATLELPEKFGTYQYPETYLLNTEHKIVSKWIGAQKWDSPQIAQAIDIARGAR
jgi:thiol-disulfide isomerase/thioredoxin